jgi:glutathione S-transferase
MARSRTKIKLYMFPGSNSSIIGQLMLDHKGVDYKLVKLPPGLHAFIMLALGFETMGVPAIKWNGRRVQGTRSISRALDEIEPAHPLFPSDPAQRKAVQDAERWGEELQNATRRVFYAGARRDRKAFRSVIVAGRSFPMRVFLWVGTGPIIRLATGAHRATEDAAREDVSLVPERLDQIDAWIAEGILGGPELNAADFQIGVNVSAMLASEDLVPYVVGRPAEALARRVLPEYGGHVGRVLPREWLPAAGGGADERASGPVVRATSAAVGGGMSAAVGGGMRGDVGGGMRGAVRGGMSGAVGGLAGGGVGTSSERTADFLRRVGIAEAKIAELLRP